MGTNLTYDVLDNYTRAFGAYLQQSGIKAGDKMAIMMPNLLQYPIVTYAALRIGVIIVNTNPLYTPREMLH